jgi:hypothetical protein
MQFKTVKIDTTTTGQNQKKDTEKTIKVPIKKAERQREIESTSSLVQKPCAIPRAKNKPIIQI